MDDLRDIRELVAALVGGRHTEAEATEALVRGNHLGPLAYRELGLAAYRDEYAACTLMAVRRSQLLAEITAAFRARSLRAAPIKGIAYAGTVYADPGVRPMNDMDLLVPRTDLPAAIEILYGMGFERVGRARKMSGYYHAIVFLRAEMMVELHRNVVQQGRTQLRIGDMWRRATEQPGSRGTTLLDPIDALLLCMLHIARHELAVPAINYVDVARQWSALDAAQREQLVERAEKSRVARAVAAVQSMTELLARATQGRPRIGIAGAVMPSTDDVLLCHRPPRARQIAQKLLLTQGPRELAGLAIAWTGALAQGLRRERS